MTTIEDLDGEHWAGPSRDESELVRRCLALRKKRLSDFTVEDLRVMLGQQLAVPILLPRAVEVLMRSPLAEGDYYPGYLFNAVVRLPGNAWDHLEHARRQLADVIEPLATADDVNELLRLLSRDSARIPEDVDELLTLCAGVGARRLHFGRVFSTGRATDALKIAERELDRTVACLYHLKSLGEPLLGRIPMRSQPQVAAMPSYDGCGRCARGVYAYISYDAGLYPCTNLYKPQWKFGDLRTQSLPEVWSRRAPGGGNRRRRCRPSSGPCAAGQRRRDRLPASAGGN